MNISEAIEKPIKLQKSAIGYLVDTDGYKTETADILQELLDTNGVGTEYIGIKDK